PEPLDLDLHPRRHRRGGDVVRVPAVPPRNRAGQLGDLPHVSDAVPPAYQGRAPKTATSSALRELASDVNRSASLSHLASVCSQPNSRASHHPTLAASPARLILMASHHAPAHGGPSRA